MPAPRATNRPELSAFLRAMRSRRRPADVGLPETDRRRTPGLRRQEVAQLAAVSIDWYIRLEQGRVGVPGAAVLDAVGQALRLSEAERHHLHLIARGEAPPPRHQPAPASESLQVMLHSMPATPAWILDFRFDVLAHNAAAAALFGPGFTPGVNTAEQLFLDPGSRDIQLDWTRIAREYVGNLRANLARHPGDPRLTALVGDLRRGSSDFAAWWDDHTVQERTNGTKRILHPTAGILTLRYDVLAVQDGSGQRLSVVTPADTHAETALRTLIFPPAGLRAVN
ncbi:transcriptional regulator [Actinoplanes philippinensis]|uniref:Helix-turn-helix domain-containing protein n=1 Tax=Actinoplanes philippinensis TaxID=35752 RepID=A0A1I2M9X2_9ACTN|nr:helix-turn-helix transcriptional regulator [Actinoplanes philippinensis]GIE83108.1 transcriptional regulator [Actinoplanes philippinensis]SFF87619.1 Helix-turn-helix domain-containing protein [Actinoplanes philippinensis]